MKRFVVRCRSGACLLALGLCLPGLALAQTTAAPADGYSQMLGYLTNSRLEGRVLAGATGSIKLNQAAGDLNLQYNGHALASGPQAQTALQVQQRGDDRINPQTPLLARAELSGQVLQGGSGLASINQASGQANAQRNLVGVVAAAQLAHSQEPAQAATPLPAPGNTSARRLTAAGVREAMVGAQALRGYSGVLQLNQIAGSLNVVENRLGLHVQTGP